MLSLTDPLWLILALTHIRAQEGSEVAQMLAADGKQTQKKTRACLHSKRRRLNLKTAIRHRAAQKPGKLNSKIFYFWIGCRQAARVPPLLTKAENTVRLFGERKSTNRNISVSGASSAFRHPFAQTNSTAHTRGSTSKMCGSYLSSDCQLITRHR